MAYQDLPTPSTWIGGHSEPAARVLPDFLYDPNDGARLQPQVSSSPDQVDRAVASAAHAHQEGEWRHAGMAHRATVLGVFADAVDALADRIALLDSLNSGVPLAFTRMFAGSHGDTIRRAGQIGLEIGDELLLPAPQGDVRLRRVPWGPAALILPWNAPSALGAKKMAYALMAGTPIVLKPSPFAPWSCELLMQAAAEAGFPPGVVNAVVGGGDVGSRLCSDPRIRAVSMTGSTATGRAIAAVAAPNFTRLHLELGSNNPVVVREDAEIALTARMLFDGMTKLNGQWCEAPRNVYAVGSAAPALVDTLGALLRAGRLGSSVDESAMIGPMAYQARRDELVAQRDAWRTAGHSVVEGTTPASGGWFFAPTLVTGKGIAVDSEVFGPLLTVERVESDDEAVALANESAGGLAAYVFGADTEAAFEVGARMLAGEVKINGTSLLDMADGSAQSFFGTSGMGGHGDHDVLEFYLGKQIVGVDLLDAPL